MLAKQALHSRFWTPVSGESDPSYLEVAKHFDLGLLVSFCDDCNVPASFVFPIRATFSVMERFLALRNKLLSNELLSSTNGLTNISAES